MTPNVGKPRPPSGVLERSVARYVALSARHGWWILLVGLVLGGAAAAIADRIEVDPRLEALLPEGTRSQRSLESLRDRAASSSPLYLLVASDDPEQNRRLSAEILASVERWPDTRWAMNRRDPSYFLERRLLYLPTADLEELADDTEELVRWQQCDSMPGCFNLDDEPPTPDLAGLGERFRALPELRALGSLFGAESLPDPEDPAPAAQGHGEDPGAGETSAGDGRLGELCSADGLICSVQVVLDGTASDLAYATEIYARSQALFAGLRPADAGEDLRLEVSGPYRNAPMTKEIVARDLSRTAALSAVLVLLLLIVQFRGLRALILLLIPLGAGAAITVGAIALVHPSLNIISAFTLAVLAGLGIDFGLHILTHYGSHREGGAGVREATTATVAALIRSMGIAGITTGCGFAALYAARFRGFAEMGVVAAIGVALMLMATLLLFPPLVLGLDRVIAEKKGPIRKLPRLAFLDGLAKPGVAKIVVAVGLALGLTGAFFGRNIAFEYDLHKVGPQSVGHGIAWGRAMHGTTRTAVYMLAESSTALEEAAQRLRASGGDGLVRTGGEAGEEVAPWIITPAAFLPPDQEARLAAIERLRLAAEDAYRHADGDLKRDIGRWLPLLSIEDGITAEDLPQWVHETFAERDGSFGRLGVLYTSLSGADARQMELLAGHMTRWREQFPDVEFASPVALLGEVVPGLRADAPLILGLALLGLVIAVSVVGRSLRRTALVLAPLVVAMTVTLGAMVALDWHINMYNMLVFPLAFGIGVDGAIYVVWASVAPGEDRLDWSAIWTSGRAVTGSTLTTVAGFGAMSISTDLGLRSLGLLSILAFSLTLVTNLLWLPAVLQVLSRRPKPR